MSGDSEFLPESVGEDLYRRAVARYEDLIDEEAFDSDLLNVLGDVLLAGELSQGLLEWVIFAEAYYISEWGAERLRVGGPVDPPMCKVCGKEPAIREVAEYDCCADCFVKVRDTNVTI